MLAVGCGRQTPSGKGGPVAPAKPPAAPTAGGAEGQAGGGEKDIVTLTDANFDSEILRAAKPAMVDFWAEWCGPCKVQAPIVEALAGKYAGQIIVGKLNVDEAKATASKYKVDAIPTLIFFKDGKELDRVVGLTQEAELAAKKDKVLLGK